MFKVNAQKFNLFVILSFVAAAMLLHGWGIAAPFYFDDTQNILNNTFVHDLKYFFQYFTDPQTHNVNPENAPYRPLCTAVYAILWALGGGSTVPFHLYKILLHILMAWLSYSILTRSNERAECTETHKLFIWLGAFIFLIHPANAETVNYISSTSTLQCAVFYLAAFSCYLDKKYIFMGLLFAASVLTKEEGATFPAAIVLYNLLLGKDRINKIALVVAGGVLAVYIAIYFGMPRTVRFSNIDTLTYFYTQLRAWVKYFVWIFWPTDFAIEHTGFGFSESFMDIGVISSAVAHLVVISLCGYFIFSKNKLERWELRILIFGVLWFYLAMLPSSSFFALSEPMNEHRYYLSYALLIPAILLFMSMIYNAKYKIHYLISAGAVVGMLFYLTAKEVYTWQTPTRVWENAIAKDPGNGRAHLNLGVQQMAMGEYYKANANFEKCQEFLPDYNMCSLNMAISWSALGDFAKADALFQRAYQLNLSHIPTLAFYGEYLIFKRANYEEGLRLSSQCEFNSRGSFARCYYGRAFALRALSRFDEALVAAKELFKREPNYVNNFDIGLTLTALNRLDEAYSLFSKFVAENPGDTQALHNLAWIEMLKGNWLQARELWFKKLKLVSGDKSAWINLVTVAKNLNDKELLAEAEKNSK